MRLLVRSWNVFHGRTHPPGRTAHLEEAVRLALRDAPDVVCLQEVPVWGLRRLEGWSGMRAVTDTTVRAGLGPVPLPPRLTRALTDVHHGRLRSLLTGQGNALLVGDRLRIVETASAVLNDRHFRRERAVSVPLGPAGRLRWALEPRIAQAARLALPSGRTVVVLNVHASHLGKDGRVADAELERAAAFAEGLTQPEEPVVFAGDFNVTAERSATLAALVARGYSPPGPGIDHVLVRGAPALPLHVWPDEQRRLGPYVLSDHAPVEVVVELGEPADERS